MNGELSPICYPPLTAVQVSMMTEETLFAEALEKGTPAERATFLDQACSADAALRQRVEALLRSHAHADFLKTPAVQRPAEAAGGAAVAGATEAEANASDASSSSLVAWGPTMTP